MKEEVNTDNILFLSFTANFPEQVNLLALKTRINQEIL